MTSVRPQRGPAAGIAWFAWLAFSTAITFHPFLWHVNYFRSPGLQFYKLALWLLPSLAIASAAYCVLRRRSFWRYEPHILAILWIAALLIYEPMATLVAAATFLSTCAAGRFLLRKLGFELRDPAGAILFAGALGLGTLICILFVLSLCHLYYAAVFAALLALPMLCLPADVSYLFRGMAASFRKWPDTAGLRHPIVGVTMVFAPILLICATMVMLAPSLAFDVLKTHLVAVRHYASQHALQPIPTVDYSFFPQGVELLMTFGFALAGQAAAQTIAAMFFALFFFLCARLARDCGAPPAACFVGAICAAAIPFLHWTGSVAKNDLGLAFFELAALSCYLEWRKQGQFRWIQLGVFFVAMSFGVKHVALFGAIPIGLLYLHAARKQQQKIRAALSLLAIFCAFGLFWHARTYLLTGNPVYPEHALTSISRSVSHRGSFGLPPGLRWASLPWELHFDGSSAFESPSANPLGIFLFVFIPLWILARTGSGNATERACLLFACIYLVYWSTALNTLRYAIVPIAIICLLTSVRVFRFYETSPTLVRVSILGAMIYCFLFAMCVMMIAEINAPQLAYFSGKLDKPGYLRQALVTYGSLEFLQNHTETGDRIFAVENCSAAYAPDPIRFQCDLCGRGHCTAADISQRVRSGSYSYLILPDRPLYADLPGDLRRACVFDDGRFAVYRLAKLRDQFPSQ